jgi:hypothetical protein
MGKLDLITALSSIEEALKRPPRAGDCRKLAARLAVVRSCLLMADIGDGAGDVAAAMERLFDAAHAQGVGNADLAAAFNAAGEKHPR